MSVNNPGKALGQFAERPGSDTIRCNKASGITITAGRLAKADVSTAPDSWVTCSAATNQLGPFVYPVETKGSGTLEFSARILDVVYLEGDAAIEPGREVQASTTIAGGVTTFVQTTLTGSYVQADQIAAQQDRQRVVGVCLGTAETWNTGAPLAGAINNLFAIRLTAGF